MPVGPAWARSNWQSFCVRLPDGCDQRAVMEEMLAERVSTRRGIMNAHLEAAYAREPWSCGTPFGRCECPGGTCERLRESEEAQERAIILPLFHQMTDAEQDQVAAALRRACARTAVTTGAGLEAGAPR